jgi:hypothetical protein
MFDFKGAAVRLPLARVLDMGHAFLANWRTMLTYGEGWDALIRSGPGSRAIGRPVPADLPKAEGSAEPPDLPEPGSGEVPAVIDGSLSGVNSGTQLEIAVDGKIEAVTTAIQTGDGVRYQAVLPPAVYERPIARMQVLQVMPDGSLALLG